MPVVTRSDRLRASCAALSRRLRTAPAVFALATVATLAACGGAGDATGPGRSPGGGGGGVTVASVVVSPTSASVASGATVSLTATPKDASGNAVAGQTIAWSTDNANVATVSSSGVVTGGTPGTATITAAAGGHQATATVTVTPAPVASVTLSASQATLIAFVADSVKLGTATVTATLKDAAGHVLSGRTVTWASSDTNVAIVSSTGVVQAIGGGTATITATSEGKVGSTAITVTLPTVEHISVTPAYDTVHVNQTATLDVRVYDANMNQIVSFSHNREYLASTIVPSITQNGDVISLVQPSSNVFHGDNPGDAVVTFKALAGNVGINAKITVIP